MISSFLYWLISKKPDLIIVTSPPLFSAIWVLIISKIKKVPYLLEIRDLWPDSIVALWHMKKWWILYKIFTNIESLLYKNARHIIWVTKWIVKEIQNKCLNTDITLMYNICDLNNNYLDNCKWIYNLINKYNINMSKKVFLYAWNHSKAQNLYNIIFLAKDYQKWVFYFLWEWEEKKKLENYVKNNKINNVFFLWQKETYEVHSFIKIANYCIASLDNNTLFNDAVPTKILEYLTFNKPVICFIKWDLAEKIKKYKAWIVTDEYSKSIIRKIDNFDLSNFDWKRIIDDHFSYLTFKTGINKIITLL